MLFIMAWDAAYRTNTMPSIRCVSLHELPCVSKVSVHNVAESTSCKSSISASVISTGSWKNIVLSKAIILEVIFIAIVILLV